MTIGITDTLIEGRKASPVFALFRLRFGTWWLALPLLIFFFLFVLMPLSCCRSPASAEQGGVTLANYERFFTDGLVACARQNPVLGLETAVVALLLGYPLALLFVAASPRFQKLLTLLIILPLLTSAVVRTFAWVVILGRQGLINEALIAMGMVSAPVPLLYTEPLLVLTLAQIELPLMTLPIISALSASTPG